MGQKFNDVLDEYQIAFDAYIKGDHNALGVIDSFAKRLKLAIAKYIIQTNNKINWDIIMKTVIDNYNQNCLSIFHSSFFFHLCNVKFLHI